MKDWRKRKKRRQLMQKHNCATYNEYKRLVVFGQCLIYRYTGMSEQQFFKHCRQLDAEVVGRYMANDIINPHIRYVEMRKLRMIAAELRHIAETINFKQNNSVIVATTDPSGTELQNVTEFHGFLSTPASIKDPKQPSELKIEIIKDRAGGCQ